MPNYYRREAIVALLTTIVAGCTSLNPLSPSDKNKTKLGSVLLINRDTKEQSVDLRVEWEAEITHNQTYVLAPFDPDDDSIPGVVTERSWPDSPGQFTVSARLGGDEWDSITPEMNDYPDCLGVTVEIEPNGRLRLLTSQNPYECSGEETQENQTNNTLI